MRKLITVAGLLAIVVAVGGVVWWLFVATLGDRQIANALAQAKANGVDITYTETERDGFPDFVFWRLLGVTVTYNSPDGRLSGNVDTLEVYARPWSPQNIHFQILKPHQWQWQPANSAPKRDYAVNRLVGTFGPQKNEPGWRWTTDLLDVEWRVADNQASPGTAEALSLNMDLPLDQSVLAYALRIDRMRPGRALPFGPELDYALTNGTITPTPKDFSFKGLSAWQANGGHISIDRTEVAYGTLQAKGKGRVGLDANLRPMGKVNLRMEDPQALTAMAVNEGWIAANDLSIARVAIGLLTRRNETGKQELKASLEMRGGALWLGPVRLSPLQPVVTATP
jgi:hypothetical protein